MKASILLLSLLFIPNRLAQHNEDVDITCSDAFCKNFVEENDCPKIPNDCLIQNSTNNGVFLPFPDACNCCDFCLVNLGEGDVCAVGDSGSSAPDKICGPGLECLAGTCRTMARIDSPLSCPRAQAEYDQKRLEGTVGLYEVRPNCDDRGNFAPYFCIPGQTCFCLDEKGNRIFGEMPFNEDAPLALRCPCSRKYTAAVELIGKELPPSKYFRCTERGDYDSVQCIGDQCFCVDYPDGAPTYPTLKSVDIDKISNETLPCFDYKIHKSGYYHECAQKYIDILDEVEEYKSLGYSAVFDFDLPQCTLDGKYSPVQRTASEFYCADADGNRIGNYSVKAEDYESTMNCKCARSNLLVEFVEKPECCPNGNFQKLQCRRGNCWCVNEDGLQTETEVKEVEGESLSCFSNPCDFSVGNGTNSTDGTDTNTRRFQFVF